LKSFVSANIVVVCELMALSVENWVVNSRRVFWHDDKTTNSWYHKCSNLYSVW